VRGNIKMVKTLWLLEVPNDENDKWSSLIPFYAIDEQEAWLRAQEWALRNKRPLPQNASLTHFPHGFRIHLTTLPGRIEENK